MQPAVKPVLHKTTVYCLIPAVPPTITPTPLPKISSPNIFLLKGKKWLVFWYSRAHLFPPGLPCLEVLQENVALLGLLTPVADDDARAVDNLAGISLAVKHACNQRERKRAMVSPHPQLWKGIPSLRGGTASRNGDGGREERERKK